jgi:BCCT, betaine/carnitine/choline family transporter
MYSWAMYAVVGLAAGYFSFRRDEPGLISPVFRPLLGDRVDGAWGKTIDVMSVLAVLFGVAVALGQTRSLRQQTRGTGSTASGPSLASRRRSPLSEDNYPKIRVPYQERPYKALTMPPSTNMACPVT